MIRVQRVNPRNMLPDRATRGSAGIDLYPAEDFIVGAMQRHQESTGLKLEIPFGHFGLLKERSGHAKLGISVLGGVIDFGKLKY